MIIQFKLAPPGLALPTEPDREEAIAKLLQGIDL